MKYRSDSLNLGNLGRFFFFLVSGRNRIHQPTRVQVIRFQVEVLFLPTAARSIGRSERLLVVRSPAHADSQVGPGICRCVSASSPMLLTLAPRIEQLPSIRHQAIPAIKGRRIRTARAPRSGHQVMFSVHLFLIIVF